MKITFLQLQQLLQQRPLATLYLIIGDEPYLMLESVELIRAQALATGRERCRYDINNDADWLACKQQLRTTPLFKQSLLYELYLNAPPTALGQQVLLAYARDTSHKHLMTVMMGRLPARIMTTAWYQELVALSVIVHLWPLLGQELLGWLIQRAATYGLQLTASAANYLMANSSGNIGAALQTIAQLRFTGSNYIDYNCISKIITDQAIFNAFDLVEQSLQGNAPQVLKILQFLEQSATPPLVILGAAVYELRSLSKIAQELQHGNKLAALYLRYRIPKMRQAAASCFLKRHTLNNCYQLICQATTIERLIKGSTSGAIWQALANFFLVICLGDRAAHLQQS